MPAATTDDRGMFRLSQLMPGTYVVVVPSTQTTMPAAFLEAPDTALRNDLFCAGVAEVALLGQPRTQQVGDFALMTSESRADSSAAVAGGPHGRVPDDVLSGRDDSGRGDADYDRGGEERTDITIALRPVPAVRVSGRLVTPDGSAPPPTTIRLVGDAMTDVSR